MQQITPSPALAGVLSDGTYPQAAVRLTVTSWGRGCDGASLAATPSWDRGSDGTYPQTADRLIVNRLVRGSDGAFPRLSSPLIIEVHKLRHSMDKTTTICAEDLCIDDEVFCPDLMAVSGADSQLTDLLKARVKAINTDKMERQQHGASTGMCQHQHYNNLTTGATSAPQHTYICTGR